jgi:hypothetical protein
VPDVDTRVSNVSFVEAWVCPRWRIAACKATGVAFRTDVRQLVDIVEDLPPNMEKHCHAEQNRTETLNRPSVTCVASRFSNDFTRNPAGWWAPTDRVVSIRRTRLAHSPRLAHAIRSACRDVRLAHPGQDSSQSDAALAMAVYEVLR